MNSFLELAKTRRSVRTFDGNWPDGAVLTTLQEFAENMTNPFGTKIRFAFLNAEDEDLSSPVLTGEKEYVTAVVQKGASNLEAAYGYSFEKLLMKAHELGLGTVWIGGTMPRGKFEKASHVEENEVMPCVSPLGKASERMSMMLRSACRDLRSSPEISALPKMAPATRKQAAVLQSPSMVKSAAWKRWPPLILKLIPVQ